MFKANSAGRVEEGLEKADTESGRLVEDMIFAFIWRLTS